MWKQRFATSVAGVGVLLAALVLAPVASARPAAAAPTDAALPSSVGTHFWLAFPANIGSQTLELHLTAETSTSATVKFGSTTIPATVQAGITEVVLIPSLMVVDELDNITAQGIEVMALDPVSVYALNTADDSTGGFLALPVTALGLDYRVLAAPATEDNQLTVVATADDTVVTVTPEVGTGPHPAGVSFSRGMDAGETYQWRASGPGDSISGTTVSANNQIVVYGGATCGYVPSDSTPDCSHMVQQMTPTNTWGTQFLTMPFAGRSPHSFYRILADEDGTELHVNGGAAFALAAGGVFDLEINSETVEIASSKPVLVAQFAYGYGAHVELLGDPLMLLLAPADRYLSRYTVPAPERVGYQAYATLIMAAADVGQITMDGVLVSTANIERIGDSGYWGLTLSFSAETHRFDGPNGFGLQVYEWGDGDGFGFTGGMAMVPGPVADRLFASGSGPWAATVDTVPVDGSVALLLNGTTPANPVTVTGQGYYSLEPNTQTIVFSPLAGYVGTPDPVTYQVTDAYGRNATNTFHPEVADRAPGTPGTPTAVAGDGQATVTFVAPDDGGTIVSYTIRVVGNDDLDCAVSGATGSCVVGGLTNGTPYVFESRATNALDSSAWSDDSTSVTPVLAQPGVAGKPVAEAFDGKATVTVVAPATGGAVTSYRVQVVGPGNPFCTVTGATGSCEVSGLTNGTTYSFEALAINAAGNSSAWSVPSNAVTPVLTAPGIAGKPTVTAADGAVEVTVVAPTVGGAVATYQVRDAAVPGRTCEVGVGETSCEVSGLTNGTAYSFEALAINAAGNSSAWSVPSDAVTPVPDVPGIPGTPVAVAGDGQATVTIQAPNGGGAVVTYTVSVFGDANKECTATPSMPSCVVPGLSNGTAYTFVALATNGSGSSGSSVASNSVTPVAALPAIPGAPGVPSVASGNTRVMVTFAVPTTGGPVATYTARVVGDSTKSCTVASPAIVCVVNGLVNGTSYRFETSATNAGGTSGWSGVSASVAPFGLPVEPVTPSVPAAPARVTATVGTASLIVSWAAVSGATGYTATARPGPATCTSTGTSCLLGAVAGTSYTVTVTANGPGGTSAASTASNAVTPKAPDVPAVPSKEVPATLTTDKGQISLAVPGQSITVVGTGFAPRSTATIILYSTPITLGTVVTDASGSFSIPVTIPAGLVPGGHTFLASGVNPAGATRQMALPVTVAPTSTGSTGDGINTPNTTIPVPANGLITLLDREGTAVAAVTVAQGTYALDAATGAITFVPMKGFVGRAAPVAYRITDSVGSVVTGSFTATVTGGGGNNPGPPASTGSARVLVGKLAVTRGVPARATLPAVVTFSGVTKARNTAILWSTVSGKRVVLGTGRAAMTVASRRAAVMVVLNPLGRAMAATPGGYPVAVAMTTVPADGGRTLRASSRTRLVLSRFTVPRAVLFASGSAAVSRAQDRYLATLRTKLAGVRLVTCVGRAGDRVDRAAGLRLGKRRALQVCRDLTARLNIRTSVVTLSDANPSGSNSTSGGMARNRRVDITLIY